MKYLGLLGAAFALSAPALANSHEHVGGATSGRSPHPAMRHVAQSGSACDAVRASVPAGKLVYHAQPALHCAELQARADTHGEQARNGR